VPECRHPVAPLDEAPSIERHDVLGGLIHEYHAVAASWIAVLVPLVRPAVRAPRERRKTEA
jgi:hypothetical protein